MVPTPAPPNPPCLKFCFAAFSGGFGRELAPPRVPLCLQTITDRTKPRLPCPVLLSHPKFTEDLKSGGSAARGWHHPVSPFVPCADPPHQAPWKTPVWDLGWQGRAGQGSRGPLAP